MLALGPAGAGALYRAIFRHCRNTDKSHAYERETTVNAESATGSEHIVSEVKGTRKTRSAGDNVRTFRERVKRVG